MVIGRRCCPHQVLAHIGQVTTGTPRASLVHPMPSRNVSLRLRDLQEKDSGSYFCFVNLQDNQGTVKGQSSKHLELDVLGEREAPVGGHSGLSPK